MPDDGASNPDEVLNNETLYRSIWLKPECFYFEEGTLHVAAQAFADSNKRPSLYREHLCDAPPYSDPPRIGSDQAVVSLIAGKIREASPILHQSEKKLVEEHVIDVKPDLSNGQHRAHCVVFSNPDFPNSNAFKKLKLRLAQLVERFDIEPKQEFIDTLPRL